MFDNLQYYEQCYSQIILVLKVFTVKSIYRIHAFSSDQRCADCGRPGLADRDPQNISDPRTATDLS